MTAFFFGFLGQEIKSSNKMPIVLTDKYDMNSMTNYAWNMFVVECETYNNPDDLYEFVERFLSGENGVFLKKQFYQWIESEFHGLRIEMPLNLYYAVIKTINMDIISDRFFEHLKLIGY